MNAREGHATIAASSAAGFALARTRARVWGRSRAMPRDLQFARRVTTARSVASTTPLLGWLDSQTGQLTWDGATYVVP